MREYSTAELDLMAKVYDRCCDKLLALDSMSPEDLEAARLRLVGGIVEAMDRGERNEARLMHAALQKVDHPRNSRSRPASKETRPMREPYPATAYRPEPSADPAE